MKLEPFRIYTEDRAPLSLRIKTIVSVWKARNVLGIPNPLHVIVFLLFGRNGRVVNHDPV